MERSGALKYYAGAAILAILIIVIAVISHGSTPAVAPQSQTANTAIATTTATAPVATTSATKPTSSSSGLVGSWGSAVAGKGVQGSGKVTVSGTNYQISLDGDVNLVIKKVEDNAAIGTIAYNNLCLTIIVSAPGKTPVTKPAQCVNSPAIPATIQINGSTLTFTGKSQLGSDISFTGDYANGTITGTFTRMSQYGKVSGSFDLIQK